jgi:hypothetical protein
MGGGGRFRAGAALYAGVVMLCAAAGSYGGPYELTTVALLLSLPAGLAYGPLGLLLGFARTVVAGAGVVLPVLSVLLVGALAVANAYVVRSLRRALAVDPASAGVQDRLARTLVGSGVAVTPMARRSERVRTDAGEVRLERSLDLRDLPMPYRELLGLFRAMWQQAGLRVQDRPDPPAVRAYDAQGYEFLVEPGPYGEAVLQVASPPARERGFVAGALSGGVPSAVLFVLGLAGLAGAGPDGHDPLAYGTYPLLGACLIAGLAGLVAGSMCLVAHRSRAFGKGLLLGGSPCVAVTLLYVVPSLLQGR